MCNKVVALCTNQSSIVLITNIIKYPKHKIWYNVIKHDALKVLSKKLSNVTVF